MRIPAHLPFPESGTLGRAALIRIFRSEQNEAREESLREFTQK